MKTTYFVMAGLIGLAVLMMATPAFAQFSEGTTRTSPLDIEVLVTDVVREHGTYADKLTFTVHVTTDESQLEITDVELYDKGFSSVYSDFCRYGDRNVSESVFVYGSKTKVLTLCFVVEPGTIPGDLTFADHPERDYGFGITVKQHILPFVSGQCGANFAGSSSCQAIQRIDRLIRDIEPEPVMCVPPPNPPPTLGSTVYHKHISDLILTFDRPVTLVDNWHEHMRIYADAEEGSVEIDGLHPAGRNIAPDGSHIVWLSLAFADASQLNGAANMTLHIDSGAIMYDDGRPLVSLLLPQVMVIP